MELQIGFDGDDFKRMKKTILAKEGNLQITFKVDDNNKISEDLFCRLIWFKAFKRIEMAMKCYPLGGFIKYYF